MEPQYASCDPVQGFPSMSNRQEEYLNNGYYTRSPVSTVHLVDQLELGGEKLERVLNRFDTHYQSLFFLASWTILTAALFSFPVALFRLDLSTMMDAFLLLFCGFLIMTLNIPGTPRWAGRYRRVIRRQARFLTRLTGKALLLLYLGSLIKGCLWPQRPKRSLFIIMFTFSLTFFVYFVGTLGLCVAIRKSLRLEQLRRSLQAVGWPDMYRKYAVIDPSHGMQCQEFNAMASDYSGGELLFTPDDLKLIFNALDDHQKNAINELEFQQWVSTGYNEDIEGGSQRHPCLTMVYL